MISAEQLTIIRTSLDASAYQAGANVVKAANAQMAASGDQVVTASEKVTRAQLGVERQMETYRKAVIDGYAEVSKFATIQDNLNRAMSLGRTTAAEATNIMGAYAVKFGLVNNEARAAAQAIQNVQIQSLAAADAMQRASQAQAAYNARSGSPGQSAPVSGTGYGASAGGGNPLYGSAYAARQTDLDAYGASLNALQAKYAPLSAAQQRYASELEQINEAVSVGAISEAEGAAAREKVTQSYLDARDAILSYNIAQRDAAALAGEQQASNAQAAYNARSGALGSNPLYGAAYDARQADAEAAFGDADKQRAAVDELYAASKRYEGVLEQIQVLNSTGVYSSAQAEAATARATENYANQANMAGSLGIAVEKTNQTVVAGGHAMHGFGVGSSYATRELIVMGDEVLRGNFTRIPGSLLVLTSHVTALREGFVRLVTSMTGLSLIGGLAAAGGLLAFSIAAEEDNRRVEALQNRLSLVRGDYAAAGKAADDAARVMSAATRDSTKDARTGAADLYANPGFQGTQQDAAEITGTFYNLSKALGETQTNWNRMSEVMSDPAAMLKELQGRVKGVTTSLIEQVQHLENSSHMAEASALAYGVLNNAVKDVGPNESKLETALRQVDTMFVSADGHGKTLTHTIGDFGTQAATGGVYAFGIVVEEITKLSKALGDLETSFKDFFGPSFTSIIQSIGTSLDVALNPFQRVLNSIMLIKGLMTPTPTASPGPLPGPRVRPDHSAEQAQADSDYQHGRMGDSGAPRGIRNNNPLNLTYTGPGNGATGSDGRFAIFPTMAAGVAADQGQLLRYQDNNGLNTIAGIIAKWAPSGENDVSSYAAQVAKALGVGVNTPINLHDPATMQAITQAMSDVENGKRFNIFGQQAQSRQAAAASAPPTHFVPVTHPASSLGQAASDSSNSGTYGSFGTKGFVTPPDTTISKAVALTSGTVDSNFKKISDNINTVTAAIALEGPHGKDTPALSQELQKLTLEQYNAIPAADGVARAVRIQTAAEQAMAGAVAQGTEFVDKATAAAKAEAAARSVAKEGTAAYTAVVAGLTPLYLAQIKNLENVALAQKLSTAGDTIAYLKEETATYTMNDAQRTVHLALFKEQQALEGKGTPEYRAQVLQTTADTVQQTEALKNMHMTIEGGLSDAWKEITHNVNDTGDAFKNLATDGIKGAEDAFVKFVETGKLNMHDLLQSIETDLIKLAEKTLIEQPIMNALGAGGQGNLWTSLFGNSFGGAGGTQTGAGGSTAGSTSPGSNNGSTMMGPLGSLLGIGKTIAGFFGGGASGLSTTATDALTTAAAGGAAVDISSLGAVGSTAGMALAGTFHGGGVVGFDNVPTHNLPASAFYGAPRFHSGLSSDEFTAVLQKGERVLTAKQNAAVTSQVKAGAEGGGPSVTNVHNWNITTPDVGGFARSQAQVTAMASRSVAYTSQRLGRG